jgi:multiple sugar transport system permease protein
LRGKYAKFIMLSPAILVLLATTTYPLLYALVISLRNWQLTKSQEPTDWVGLDNYTQAFTDSGFTNSLQVTFLFTILSVSLSLGIGLAIALLVQKKSLVNTIIKTLLIFPFAVSPTLKGFSWKFMLNSEYGLYDHLVKTVFPPARDIIWLNDTFWAMFSLAMSETWGWAPLIALMFVGALGTISPEITEAARLDGANNVSLFFYVTLPLLRPVILIALLLKTIFSLKMFDQVVTMTGGGPGRSTQTFNYFIYQVGFRNLDMGYASALAIMLVIFLSILAYLYVKLLLGKQV